MIDCLNILISFLLITLSRAVYEAPNTIRGLYGLTDTRNAVHGSDSEDSALEEIAFYFKDFSIDQWRQKEENFFINRSKLITFDPIYCVHEVKGENRMENAN